MILFPDYLFNVGKAASTQVAKTAIQIKDTVEEKVNQNQNQKCFIWPKENIYLFIQFIIVTVGQGDPP